MSYMRGACGVSRWDRDSNEDMYRRFGMSETAVGMDCGVGEWVKRSTLRWYGHVMRMNECDFAKRVYESKIEGRGVRGRPPVKWINRVEEYWSERTGGRGLECAERECLNRETWRQFCHSQPLGGGSREGDLQRVVNEFCSVCKRRKLKGRVWHGIL